MATIRAITVAALLLKRSITGRIVPAYSLVPVSGIQLVAFSGDKLVTFGGDSLTTL